MVQGTGPIADRIVSLDVAYGHGVLSKSDFFKRFIQHRMYQTGGLFQYLKICSISAFTSVENVQEQPFSYGCLNGEK